MKEGGKDQISSVTPYITWKGYGREWFADNWKMQDYRAWNSEKVCTVASSFLFKKKSF